MLLIFVLGWTPLEQLNSLAFLRNASLDRRRQHNTPNQHKKSKYTAGDRTCLY